MDFFKDVILKPCPLFFVCIQKLFRLLNSLKECSLVIAIIFSPLTPICICIPSNTSQTPSHQIHSPFPCLGSSLALALMPLPSFETYSPALPLWHRLCPGAPFLAVTSVPTTRVTYKREKPGDEWCQENEKWWTQSAGGADCWSQVIRLPSGRPQNTGSSFPFLTLLARLPSILGRYSSWPRVRGLTDNSRKLGRSKCVFTRTACKPWVCSIKRGCARWQC